MYLVNRFRLGVGRCNYGQSNYELTPDQSCDCEVDIQTMEHKISSRYINYFWEGLARRLSVREAGNHYIF